MYSERQSPLEMFKFLPSTSALKAPRASRRPSSRFHATPSVRSPRPPMTASAGFWASGAPSAMSRTTESQIIDPGCRVHECFTHADKALLCGAAADNMSGVSKYAGDTRRHRCIIVGYDASNDSGAIERVSEEACGPHEFQRIECAPVGWT